MMKEPVCWIFFRDNNTVTYILIDLHQMVLLQCTAKDAAYLQRYVATLKCVNPYADCYEVPYELKEKVLSHLKARFNT
jgi:hypothetical protein